MGGALAMVASLLFFQWSTLCEAVVRSVLLAGGLLTGGKMQQEKPGTARSGEDVEEGSVESAIYEGVVWHERRHPIHHQFEYKVRYAFVNLDATPSWFAASSRHHMTAEQVRSLVGTSGPVHLLCMPKSVGYEQNPISVYYCYDDGGPAGSPTLSKTIAEVTNTPWGERVTFAFDSKHDGVPKPLHVSPFMDMEGIWRIHAPAPGEKLYLTVGVEHPDFGHYFLATLRARRVDPGQSPEWFLWLMPQTVAVWIYWQALVLLWKGVAFVQHPKYVDGALYRARAQDRDAKLRLEKDAGEELANSGRARVLCPRLCKWQDADGYPWL